MRRYTGIDVVRSVISENSAAHAKTHTWEFKVADFYCKTIATCGSDCLQGCIPTFINANGEQLLTLRLGCSL